MSAATPAGRLASRFSDVDATQALYAPGIEWTISASLGVPRLIGREAVVAFNRQVWTDHHHPDCTVTILDETGGEAVSAIRFTYRAWSLFARDWYQNEYTLFVRSGANGIDHVTEAFDCAATIDFLARRPTSICRSACRTRWRSIQRCGANRARCCSNASANRGC